MGGVWKVWEVSVWCLEGVWKESGGCLVGNWKLSGWGLGGAGLNLN